MQNKNQKNLFKHYGDSIKYAVIHTTTKLTEAKPESKDSSAQQAKGELFMNSPYF